MQKFILAAIAATFVAAEQAAVPEADNKTDEDALYYSRHSYYGHPAYGYGHGYGYGHPYAGFHHGYAHPAFYDNEAEAGKDNKTEEDAIFYRRHGYYPAYHGYRGYGYGHPAAYGYGYHGYGYGHPAFYDNEAEAGQDNKTEEDAIFYRRYGYYPRRYGYGLYGHHGYAYGPGFYDNEAEGAKDNKTEEDAIFYRTHGYYPHPGYHRGTVVDHHRTVTPAVSKTKTTVVETPYYNL